MKKTKLYCILFSVSVILPCLFASGCFTKKTETAFGTYTARDTRIIFESGIHAQDYMLYDIFEILEFEIGKESAKLTAVIKENFLAGKSEFNGITPVQSKTYKYISISKNRLKFYDAQLASFYPGGGVHFQDNIEQPLFSVGIESFRDGNKYNTRFDIDVSGLLPLYFNEKTKEIKFIKKL